MVSCCRTLELRRRQVGACCFGRFVRARQKERWDLGARQNQIAPFLLKHLNLLSFSTKTFDHNRHPSTNSQDVDCHSSSEYIAVLFHLQSGNHTQMYRHKYYRNKYFLLPECLQAIDYLGLPCLDIVGRRDRIGSGRYREKTLSLFFFLSDLDLDRFGCTCIRFSRNQYGFTSSFDDGP